VGPRAGLVKISSPPGFDPRTVQPLAIRYTGYAIQARNVQSTGRIKVIRPICNPRIDKLLGKYLIFCD